MLEHWYQEGEAREIGKGQILEGTVGHTEEFYIDSAGIEGSFRAECFHISVLETLFHSQYIQISNRYVIHLKLICQLYLKKKKNPK